MTWRLGRALYCRARREPRDDDIGSNGETYVQRCVIGACRPDETLIVVDVGANVGDWTLPLLNSLPPDRLRPERTRLHLVEPVPTTRDALKHRLAASPAGALATVHAFALSDSCGISRMSIVEPTGGRNSLTSGSSPGDGGIDVETKTLTLLFQENGIARAQLVKCDAEGFDPAVIRGGRELLAEGRIDVLQFEYNHNWVSTRSFLKDVFDLVEGLPYRIARVCPQSVEVYDAWHFELERFFHCNYLIVREPALAWFNAERGCFDNSNTYA